MENTGPATDRITFVGFGEAARAFLSGWGAHRPHEVRAFDLKSNLQHERAAILAAYEGFDISGSETLEDALDGMQLVFSLVTADQALEAARAAAPYLEKGAFWLDCNSCAPGTKAAAAALIGEVGGIYVDVAVMAPVSVAQHRVPLLVSGPDADTADLLLRALDMKPTVTGHEVGQASAIKMLRSVMIKGFEALTSECFLAARRAGVEEQVIASLEASDAGVDWRRRGAYNLERMMVHGARRAAEMREVVVMLNQLGLPSGMSAATVEWQASIAALGLESGTDDLIVRADTLLARL